MRLIAIQDTQWAKTSPGLSRLSTPTDLFWIFPMKHDLQLLFVVILHCRSPFSDIFTAELKEAKTEEGDKTTAGFQQVLFRWKNGDYITLDSAKKKFRKGPITWFSPSSLPSRTLYNAQEWRKGKTRHLERYNNNKKKRTGKSSGWILLNLIITSESQYSAHSVSWEFAFAERKCLSCALVRALHTNESVKMTGLFSLCSKHRLRERPGRRGTYTVQHTWMPQGYNARHSSQPICTSCTSKCLGNGSSTQRPAQARVTE